MSKLKPINKTSAQPFLPRPVTPYSRAIHTPLVQHERRPDYKPPVWEPARPGADDYKQFKSRGV